jgi:hypothetical protein
MATPSPTRPKCTWQPQTIHNLLAFAQSRAISLKSFFLWPTAGQPRRSEQTVPVYLRTNDDLRYIFEHWPPTVEFKTCTLPNGGCLSLVEFTKMYDLYAKTAPKVECDDKDCFHSMEYAMNYTKEQSWRFHFQTSSGLPLVLMWSQDGLLQNIESHVRMDALQLNEHAAAMALLELDILIHPLLNAVVHYMN